MKSNPDNRLSASIVAAYRKTGWSLKRLSDESGVAYSCVHGLVSGQRDIACGTAARLLEAMGLTLVLQPAESRKAK